MVQHLQPIKNRSNHKVKLRNVVDVSEFDRNIVSNYRKETFWNQLFGPWEIKNTVLLVRELDRNSACNLNSKNQGCHVKLQIIITRTNAIPIPLRIK